MYVAHLGGGQVNTATGDFVFGMTEAYLIEDGQITEPIREGNLIGNGPAVLASIDAVGHDFAMGSPGMCGKDGQGVPGRRRRPDPAGARPHRRRHRVDGAPTNPELLDVAARIAEMAGPGEQVEAFVARSTSTVGARPTAARSRASPRPARPASACA